MTRQAWKLPLYAFGASSGGSFVQILPRYINIDGVIAQIAPPMLDFLKYMKDDAKARKVPPMVFSHMSRDHFTSQAVAKGVEVLRLKNITASSVLLQPVSLSGDFFSSRIEGVSKSDSMALVNALNHGGMIEANTGFLKEDPRQSNWRVVLKRDSYASSVSASVKDSLVEDESAIAEELNVAWCLHEISADGFEELLKRVFFGDLY